MSTELGRVAVVGCGVMGEAIVGGLISRGLVGAGQILVSHPREERRRDLVERHGVRATGSNVEVALGADIVVLAVKPQVLPAVLVEIGQTLGEDQLIVSIAAGVPLASIESKVRSRAVVRVVPNTPSRIGQGLSAWSATAATTDAQLDIARSLLGSLGKQVYFTDEKMLDAATAISGSGPAYCFLLMEALIDAGVHLGLSRARAHEMVVQTFLGSALFAAETGGHPAELRNQVTSPAGTTAAALFELEQCGVRAAMSKAAWAAFRRARALGEGKSTE